MIKFVTRVAEDHHVVSSDVGLQSFEHDISRLSTDARRGILNVTAGITGQADPRNNHVVLNRALKTGFDAASMRISDEEHDSLTCAGPVWREALMRSLPNDVCRSVA